MQSLVVLLSKAVVYWVEILKPTFNGLELNLILLIQLFLYSRYILLQLHQFLWLICVDSDFLETALNIFK